MLKIDPSVFSHTHLKLARPGQPTVTKEIPAPGSFGPDVINKVPPVKQVGPITETTDPVDAPTSLEELEGKLFNLFDADNNGLVTREEVIARLTAKGRDEEFINRIVDNVFSPTSDLNGDGLSWQEVLRRRAIREGDEMAHFDFNRNGDLSAQEIEDGIALYSKYQENFNEAKVRATINAADANKDGTLTGAEWAAYEANPLPPVAVAEEEPVISDTATYSPPAPPVDDGPKVADVSPVAKLNPSGIRIKEAKPITPPADTPTLKPPVTSASVVTLDSELLVALQNQS